MPATATPRVRCLEVLRRKRTATVGQLAAHTGLSRPTIEGLLEDLANDGFVDSEPVPARPGAAGGRPARQYRFRGDRGYVVGLDLTGTCLRMVVADLTGRVVHADTVGPRSPHTGASQIEPVRDWVTDSFLAAGLPLGSLAAVTVGVTGIVTAAGRLATSPGVREWARVDITARFAELFDCPVAVENDLVLAATAEAALGAAQLADTSLYVLSWFHVAARLVSGGKVHFGRNRQAGEMASLRVLTKTVHQTGWKWDDLDRADQLLSGLDDGAPEANATLLELADCMAPAVAGLLAAVDPEVVVLGGPLGKYSRHLAPLLHKRLNEQLSLEYEYPIIGSELGELGVPLGGVLRAFADTGESLVKTPGISVPGISGIPFELATARAM